MENGRLCAEDVIRPCYHMKKGNQMVSKPDYVEVGREAHELAHRLGRDAYRYAAKLAADALEEGKLEASGFWKAVEMALTPRAKSS